MKKKPILAGVIGSPVAHSLSPLIHTVWAYRAQIDGYYIPIEIAPSFNEFSRAMDALRTVGFAGVNVTIPHKEHALRYADKSSDPSSVAGAANMLTFADDNCYADNSDISGFEEAFTTAGPAVSANDTALVLGAGGAARAIIIALQSMGVREIIISNRTEEKAAALAEAFGLKAVPWPERNTFLEAADIIVNTTSLGMTSQPPLELETSKIKPGAVVADIVYAPLETKLLKAASAQGNPTVDGLAMLMHQAAPGFRAWFGGEARVDEALRAELVGELKRRKRQ